MTANVQSAEPNVSETAGQEPFANHPGYQRMFAPDKLTIGVFLPLRFYQGDMNVLKGQAEIVSEIDRRDFAAVWVRDVPLFDPNFGDAGQLFDPFTYLSYLAAKTERVALATGSAIFTLRHPIDLAKAAVSIDQLSGGRLVLGIASGDRPVEFPAYGIDFDTRGQRFADSVEAFRALIRPRNAPIRSPLGEIPSGVTLLPAPAAGSIPVIVTGSSRQSLDWIAEHSDGWLTYPGPSTAYTPTVLQLRSKIDAWRSKIPGGAFRPHMTNEWIDLVDDPDFPRRSLRGGFVLRTGRKGLIQLLEEWQSIGVNHAALGVQFADRPAREIIDEMAEEVLPLFPTHKAPEAQSEKW